MPTVSVIIRALNEEKHLGRLLSGLERQTKQPDEIILVDSGSTDDTVAIAEKYGASVVTIDKSEFTFGRSLNRGCSQATSDLLLIVSAHVYPLYDAYLENIVRPFDNPGVSIAYGRQVGDERTKFSESRVLLRWFPEESIFDQGHPFTNNANAVVRREVWERFRYDEELTGLEDLEFAKRVMADGGRVSYVAEAPIVHVHEESWETIRNRYRREAVAYRRIMNIEPMSMAHALRLGAINSARDCAAAARSRRLRGNVGGILRFRYAQFYGTWEGFRYADRIDNDLLRRFYYPGGLSPRGTGDSLGEKLEYVDH